MASQVNSAVRDSSSENSPRLEALKSRHAYISSRIEKAQKSLSTTDYYLRQLKKQKLKLKEAIESESRA